MQWDRTGWDGIDVNEITVQGDRGYFCSRNSAGIFLPGMNERF